MASLLHDLNSFLHLCAVMIASQQFCANPSICQRLPACLIVVLDAAKSQAATKRTRKIEAGGDSSSAFSSRSIWFGDSKMAGCGWAAIDPRQSSRLRSQIIQCISYVIQRSPKFGEHPRPWPCADGQKVDNIKKGIKKGLSSPIPQFLPSLLSFLHFYRPLHILFSFVFLSLVPREK